MRNIIWVTAPSGAGKTIVLNELLKYFNNSQVLTDAAEMLALNKQDKEHLYHIHPFDDERFVLTSTHHFDQAVKNICNILANMTKDKIILVELARGTGDSRTVDSSYRRLLALIPKTVFENSVFIHIEVSYNQRIYRNNLRKIAGFSQNINEQSFSVPEEAMNSFYRSDDFSAMSSLYPCPIFILDNDNIPKEELTSKIKALSTRLKDIIGL